ERNRANAVGHDPVLLFNSIVDLRIVGEYRLSGFYHANHSAAAISIGASIDRLPPFIKRDRKIKFIGHRINQREKASFRIDELDHLLHHQTQHLVKLKRRVQHTRNIVEGLEFVAFSFENINTAIESLPLSFKWRSCAHGSLLRWNTRLSLYELQHSLQRLTEPP